MDTATDLSEFFDVNPANELDEAFAHEFIAKGEAKYDNQIIDDTDTLPLTVRQNLARVQDRYADRFNVTTENVIAELAKCAFFDPKDLFTRDGKLKPFHELDSQVSAAITGMKVTQVGGSNDGWVEQIQLKFADKLKALDMLGKQLGLFKDNIKIDENETKIERSDNERARRVGFVLERLLIERAKNSQGNVAP